MYSKVVPYLRGLWVSTRIGPIAVDVPWVEEVVWGTLGLSSGGFRVASHSDFRLTRKYSAGQFLDTLLVIALFYHLFLNLSNKLKVQVIVQLNSIIFAKY